MTVPLNMKRGCKMTHVLARLSGRGYTALFQPSAGKNTDGCET